MTLMEHVQVAFGLDLRDQNCLWLRSLVLLLLNRTHARFHTGTGHDTHQSWGGATSCDIVIIFTDRLVVGILELGQAVT